MATAKEMDRIKKLIALSESSNFGDAANAAALASKLLHQLNLTIEDVDLEEGMDPLDEYGKDLIDFFGKERWRHWLLGHICDANNAKMLYYSGGRNSGRFGSVVGRPHEREFTTWMYGYLVGQLKRMATAAWKEEQIIPRYPWDATSRHVFFNSFYRGAVRTIGNRLKEQREEQSVANVESRALVLNRDALAQSALDKLHPKLSKARSGTVDIDSRTYAKGQQAGRDVSFNKPVTPGKASAQIGGK